MKISSKSGNTELMAILLSFFRVFLINQLQNKKTQFKLVKDGEIIQEWKKLNESNIRISGTIDNMKIEQICVSISYWLCSIRKEFVKECIVNGIINFLIRSLVNKLTSEWYGKKIINFLKLLLLQIEGKQNFFSQSEFELFLAKFTMKYDGQETIQQVRNLFSSLQVDYCEKVEKNKSVLKKYNEKKESKDLKALVEEIRILVLYA